MVNLIVDNPTGNIYETSSRLKEENKDKLAQKIEDYQIIKEAKSILRLWFLLNYLRLKNYFK